MRAVGLVAHVIKRIKITTCVWGRCFSDFPSSCFNNQLSLVGGVCTWSQGSSFCTARCSELPSDRKEKFCHVTSKPLNGFPNDSGLRTSEHLKTKGDTESGGGRGGSHHSPCDECWWVVLSTGRNPASSRARYPHASIQGHRKGFAFLGSAEAWVPGEEHPGLATQKQGLSTSKI